MRGKGPRIERETIINFNEAEPDASVWTASEPMYHKMLRAGYQPSEDSERSATFMVPKKLVSVRKARHISAARRKELAVKARSIRRPTVITEAKHVNNRDEL